MQGFKVVIIDDNEMVVKALTETIDWGLLSCAVVGMAYDGRHGAELIAKNAPDIIISDNIMPFVNGLEMIGSLPAAKNAKVIMITGYKDFEYTSLAIRLSVFDYILKPVDNSELIAAVKRATDKIQKERKNEQLSQQILSTNRKMKKQIRDSINIRKTIAVIDALGSPSDGYKDVESVFKNADIQFVGFLILVAYVRSPKIPPDQIMSGLGRHFVGYTENEEILTAKIGNLIVSTVMFTKKLPSISKQYAVKLFDRLTMLCDDDREAIVKVVSSGLHTRHTEFSKTYHELVILLQMAILEGNSRHVYYTGDYTEDAQPDYPGILKLVRDTCTEIDSATDTELEGDITRFLKEVSLKSMKKLGAVKFALIELLMQYVRDKDIIYVLPSVNSQISDILNDFGQINDTEWIRRVLLDIIHKLRELNVQQYRNGSVLVRGAMKYIYSHPCSQLSLTNVAEQLKVNPSYLSRIIKQETGQNYRDLMLSLKAALARQLLDDPSNRVEEVGHAVGYSSYQGFLRAFKEAEGMSPQEYRSRAGNQPFPGNGGSRSRGSGIRVAGADNVLHADHNQ